MCSGISCRVLNACAPTNKKKIIGNQRISAAAVFALAGRNLPIVAGAVLPLLIGIALERERRLRSD